MYKTKNTVFETFCQRKSYNEPFNATVRSEQGLKITVSMDLGIPSWNKVCQKPILRMRRSAAYILAYKYGDGAFETFCQEKSGF